MDSVKFSVEKKIIETVELKVGDSIRAIPSDYEWHDIKGKVTYIFDNGKRCIIDDSMVIYTSQIFMINGKRIKN
jgi:hypothetical protein